MRQQICTQTYAANHILLFVWSKTIFSVNHVEITANNAKKYTQTKSLNMQFISKLLHFVIEHSAKDFKLIQILRKIKANKSNMNGPVEFLYYNFMMSMAMSV